MLSRVAERVYWLGRYLERVENSARLVAVYHELLLDLPEDAQLDWAVPLEILGMGESWAASGSENGELDFMLADRNNMASMLSALHFARENARTTRDIVPSEAWRAINEMNLYALKHVPSLVKRPRSVIPAEIVGRCQEVTGILEGTMSHGPAYRFIRLGRSLERADMSSRIIDVAAAILLVGRDDLRLYDGAIWRAVLKALSAYQMYSQYVRRRVLGLDVLSFLLHDPYFPRSITQCLQVMEASVENLPRNTGAREQLEKINDRLEGVDLHTFDHRAVHVLMDEIQLDLASLHGVVFETWLNPMSAA